MPPETTTKLASAPLPSESEAGDRPVSNDTAAQRVLVVTSDVPFVEGGHIVIAKEITRALNRYGHVGELVTTPQNRFGRQFSAYVANWCTDVGETGAGEPVDRVISLRYPSFAVRHPNHVCWLNHRMREY